MKKLILAGLILAVAAGMVAAGSSITIKGSDTLVRLGQRWAEEYMKLNKDAVIQVSGGGSGTGIAALLNGSTDICEASRDMKKKEYELAEKKGLKPYRVSVALDGIAVYLNEANPVTDLTIAQLKDIYSGKIKNWKEVGGADMQIVAVSRDSSSGTFEVWNHRVLGKKTRVRPDAQLQASNGAVAQAVAGNKNAIGYVGIGYLNDKLKGLKVGGVMASAKTAMDKSYPIARGLNMYTRGEPKGVVKQFIDFVMSAEGQKIVVEEGFVSLK